MKRILLSNCQQGINQKYGTIFLNDSNIESKLKKSTAVFIDLIDEHMCKESGYTLKSFIGIEMNVDEYEPLRGSSYIDLPKFLKVRSVSLIFKTMITSVSVLLLNQHYVQ